MIHEGRKYTKICAASSHCELQDVIQQVTCCSLGDDCLDDVTADLISLTVCDSNSSSINIDIKNPSLQSTPKSNSDNSPMPTGMGTQSDSFLVILNSHSEENSVFSSIETLTKGSDVGLSKMCDISSQKVVRDSGTLYNTTEKLNVTSLEQTTLQQSINPQNIHGFTPPQINQDKNKSFAKCKLSLSLHDVSTLPDFPLKCKSRDFSSDTIQSQSVITISSGLKSKDSGLPRSVSCFSLSSDRKNYEHIQSKVKEYIKQIKEADERKKSLKLGDIYDKSIHADDLNYVSDENGSVASEETLTAVIKDLHYELQDKEILLSKLQDNYDKLLIKYAEAENRIDQLRFKVIDPSLELAGQKEEQSHPESSVLNSAKKYTFPYNRTSGMRADAKSLSSDIKDSHLSKISAYNDKIISNENPCPSSALFREQVTRQNVALNPLVKPYSSSVRLGTRMKPLPQNSGAKTFEELFKSKLSVFSTMSKGRSNSERMHGSSATQSHEQLGNTTCSYQKNMCCQCMGNDGTAQGAKCDPEELCEDVRESGLLQPRQCREIPVASEIEISSYCKKKLLCKRSLERSGPDYLQNTSFEKVSRWQESLPPVELIEPNCYESLDWHSNGSKTASHNFIKKLASPGGLDSGCAHSELCSFSVQPNSVKFYASQATKYQTDFEAKDMSLQTEPEGVAQHTDHKIAFQSLPCNRTISHDGRMLDNCGDLHLLVSVSDSIKQSECSQNTTEPKFLNINSCECRENLEVKRSGDIMNSSASLHPCDQKPKNIFPDFQVPPLKLDSSVGDDDGDDSDANGVNSTNSSGVAIVSESKKTSKSCLYYSSYEESSNSSRQGTSEGITYSSSTRVTSDSQAFKTLNKGKVASNNICLSLSNASDTDFQEGNCNLLKIHGKEAEGNQHNDVHPVKNNVSERRMNHTTIQNDSLEGSVATSTTYRSLQPYKTVGDIKRASSRHYCGRKPTHLDQTDDHSILSHIPVHMEGHESSAHHAVGVIESDISRRKLLGSALRYLLLAFFSTEKCLAKGCICHRSSSNPVAPRNHIRNVGTYVNLTSTLNDTDCGAKGSLATDGIVNTVMEAASSKGSDSISGRINEVSSTIIPKDQSVEKAECNLVKCLHEMDRCAQQLKARSERILNILAVQLKPSS